MQTSTYEVLEKIGKLRRTKEKVEALRTNDSYIIRIILQGVFDESIKWMLPEGDPPYTPNDLVDLEGILINEARKILYFVEGFHDLPLIKRESMFLELLEQVNPKDAILLCAIKDKKLPFNGITIQHVKEAFPGMIQDG